MAYTGPFTPGTKVKHAELGLCAILGYGPGGLVLEPDTEEGKEKLFQLNNGAYSFLKESNLNQVEKPE